MPHPFPSQSALSSPPLFTSVWTLALQDKPTIAMLRNETPELNAKDGNELVPKDALDLLFLAEADSYGRPGFGWAVDVTAVDGSGHVAATNNSCLQVGDVALVLRFGGSMPLKQGENGFEFCHGDMSRHTPAAIDALDFSTLEWRGTKIRNLDLLDTNKCSIILLCNHF